MNRILTKGRQLSTGMNRILTKGRRMSTGTNRILTKRRQLSPGLGVDLCREGEDNLDVDPERGSGSPKERDQQAEIRLPGNEGIVAGKITRSYGRKFIAMEAAAKGTEMVKKQLPLKVVILMLDYPRDPAGELLLALFEFSVQPFKLNPFRPLHLVKIGRASCRARVRVPESAGRARALVS